MAKILDMPKLSPTMEEGTLVQWHKNEGDSVTVDDLLAEVETDKATMEFRAFDKGTLLKILVPAGTNVKLGQAVAILGNAGEDVGDLVAQAGGAGGEAPKPSKAEGKAEEKSEKARAKNEKSDDGETDDDDAEDRETDDAQSDDGDADDEATGTGAESAKKSEGTTDTQAKAKTKAKAQPKESPKGGEREARRSVPKPSAPKKKSLLDRTERDVALDAGDESDVDANGDGKSKGRVLASPYVRKVARERGIDLASARGTGEHGRIVPSDLDVLAEQAMEDAPTTKTTSASLARPAQSELAAPSLVVPEARPLSPMRKTIARRLTLSKTTVPHFYLTIDVDAGALTAFRESINAQLAEGSKKKNGGASDDGPKPDKISLNDLVIKAVAGALVRVPECNAQFSDDALLIHRRVDISVAVAIPDGLVTPVVRNADQKSVVAIAREVRDLAARARGKKLKPEEMSDGTFSISNLGMFGIDEFSAVINPPEGAILAIGQTRDEPVIGKDGSIVAGKKMSMTLSCDHRVIDGAVGAAFLAELRALLEHPMRILTG